MINNGFYEYIFIRAVIIVLHSVGPLCAAYTATLARRFFINLKGPNFQHIWETTLEQQPWREVTLFQWWCIAETAFYVFFLWYRTHLQHEANHPPLRTKAERKALFDKVHSEIFDPPKFLSGWFKGAEIEDIRRDDLKDFFSWTFWEGRTGKDDEEELEEMVKRVEETLGREFKPGRGGAKGLRLTLDPIEMEWRCLLWYTIIMLVDTVSHIRLLWYGMKFYSTTDTTLKVFPPRPLAAAIATGQSPVKSLSYWLRPHTSQTRLPILYLHGIGVGLHPDIEFLHETETALNADAKEDDKVGILSLEILQISNRLTRAIPPRAEFLKQLTQILDRHGLKRFVLVAHSFGSVLSTYILTDDTLTSRVASTLLVDPVSILLHTPSVAYNFTARKPQHANEWQLWYFGSKDPGVAYTLGRHFFWHQKILWRDRIIELAKGGMRMTVSLGKQDLIVDTEAVASYLADDRISNPATAKEEGNGKPTDPEEPEKEDSKVKEWKTRPWRGKGVEVLWWDDLDHADVYDDKATRAKLVHVLAEYTIDR